MSASWCFHTISSKSTANELCDRAAPPLAHTHLNTGYIIFNILSCPLLFWVANLRCTGDMKCYFCFQVNTILWLTVYVHLSAQYVVYSYFITRWEHSCLFLYNSLLKLLSTYIISYSTCLAHSNKIKAPSSTHNYMKYSHQRPMQPYQTCPAVYCSVNMQGPVQATHAKLGSTFELACSTNSALTLKLTHSLCRGHTQ